MTSFAVVFSRTLLGGGAVSDGDAGLAPPPLDVVERRGALVIEVDLPGAAPADLRVTCQGDVVVIEGVAPESVRTHACRALVERFHRVERAAGPFRRVLRLPWPVDASRGQARVRDGVLTITLPRGDA